MMHEIFEVLEHATMITGFVFVMMLVIEYINVQTMGIFQNSISKNIWKQYLFAAFLGVIPGCLGAFTAVALFTHRLISFGAIVTAMIATSGDEAFVMFAMFPKQAILLSLIIVVIGIIAGYITDKLNFSKNFLSDFETNKFPLHKEDKCICFEKKELLKSIKNPSIYRITITVFILLLLSGFASGILAAHAKTWIRTTILIVTSFSLFIVVTVPEHFLKKHLWEHVVKGHIPRIFAWTFSILLIIHFLMAYINVEAWISQNMFIVMIIAVLVGVIPESGPHLIFVTLFAQGSIPFSILLASSIAQDGHGMLPLLAESKKSFFAVKLVNISFALIAGTIGYFAGF